MPSLASAAAQGWAAASGQGGVAPLPLDSLRAGSNQAALRRAGPAMHSVELARGGAVVYAVEQSAAMVEHARRKAAAAGVDLHLIQGDMETFLLPVCGPIHVLPAAQLGGLHL